MTTLPVRASQPVTCGVPRASTVCPYTYSGRAVPGARHVWSLGRVSVRGAVAQLAATDILLAPV